MHKGDDEVSWSQRIKLVLAILSILSFLVFAVLAVIRADADYRGTSVGGIVLPWIDIIVPAVAGAGLLMLWLVINFISQRPLTADTPGNGGQLLYNLLTQLLVKQVEPRSIETYNESLTLRDFLRSVAFITIIAYSSFLAKQGCPRCDVPYRMLAFGFIGTYFFRLLMLGWNGYHSFLRHNYMSQEVKYFQESMDSVRLFDHTIPDLTGVPEPTSYSGPGTYAPFIDLFLWCSSMVFFALGYMWTSKGTCESLCGTTFHLYQYLLITVCAIEAFNIVVTFALVYYRRIAHIEGLEILMEKIEENNKKQDEMMLRRK